MSVQAPLAQPAVAMLLVDDDRNDVEIALRALHREGLDGWVRVARDGQEALEALGLEPPSSASGSASGHDDERVRPAVVFLDLKMPRVDGWEVLQRIRNDPETTALPVVVISSSDREMDIQRCYELGANSFLVKRFDPRSAGAYIAEAARYWLELNRQPPRRRRPA